MSDSDKSDTPDNSFKFSNYRFLIPFGRYRLDKERNATNTSVYVGREGHRAFLIDALNGGGRRGAFLVTGRRGVGKTTFVESCIDEYQNAIFRRFLRSNYGRSGIDLLVMMGLALLTVMILIVCSNTIEILSGAVHQNHILWLPLLFLSFIVMTPLFMATHIIRVLVNHYKDEHSASSRKTHLTPFLEKPIPFVLTLIFIITIWTSEPFGAPSEGITRSILFFCLLGLSSTLPLFFPSRPRSGKKNILHTSIVFISCFSLSYYIIDIPEFFYKDSNIHESLHRNIYYICIAASLGFSSMLIHWALLSYKKNKSWQQYRARIKTAYYQNIFGGLVVFLFLTIVTSAILHDINFTVNIACTIVVISITLAIVTLCLWGFYKTKLTKGARSIRFVPPLESLLLAKAFILVLISLQLLYPVFGVLENSDSWRKLAIIENLLSEDVNNNDKKGGWLRSSSPLGVRSPDSFTTSSPPFTNHKLLQKYQYVTSFDNLARTEYLNEIEHFSLKYSITKEEDTTYLTLFPASSYEEIAWWILVSLLFVTIYYLEYEWINRPYIAQRQTGVLDNGPRFSHLPHHDFDHIWHKEVKGENNQSESFHEREEKTTEFFRRLERVTFVYFLCSFWMPSIVAKINLGFDSLDHKGVIHTMLYGLKQEYKKNLLSWQSSYFLLVKFVWICFLLLACSTLGRNYLEFPKIKFNNFIQQPGEQQEHLVSKAFKDQYIEKDKSLNYCKIINDHPIEHNENKLLVASLCESLPGLTNTLIPTIYASVIEIPTSSNIVSDNHYMSYFFHHNVGHPELVNEYYKAGREVVTKTIRQEESLDLRVYHVLIFILLIWISHRTSNYFTFLPYRNTLKKINTIIDDLNLRKTEHRKPGKWTPGYFFNKATGNETESELSRDERDPRTIELAFLSLLEDMQNINIKIPFLPGSKISIPTPEIHFVFDELDKITGMVGNNTISPESNAAERSLIQDERKRAFALHSLLSDMKRIISSAPARFIFVGSRMLHDEWMADQGRRQPLLASIFDAEIYLPSLMLDLPQSGIGDFKPKYPHPKISRLTFRVEEYFLRTHDSSAKLFEQVFLTRFSPFFSLDDQEKHKAKFYESTYNELRRKAMRDNIKIVKISKTGTITLGESKKLYEGFLDEYINFLTYRSAGTPKKIDEILSSFMRPAARFTAPATDKRYEELFCRDVLSLTNSSIYRVQLINSLFKHLTNKFEDVLSGRDDKVSVNIIYLFDFLMKFHQRAFSWNSLDRIDELSHMHRAPDIRKIFENVVHESVEKYLHKIFHGLYAFRFRSDFSAEIKFLSRSSKPEMAAFNFTLDESQELKAIYMALLEVPGSPNVDVVEALGELYEYDQAYETARGHYEQAMALHDEKFMRYMGETVDVEDEVYEAFKSSVERVKKNEKINMETTELLKKKSNNKKENQPEKPVPYDTARLAMLLTNVSSPERVPLIKAVMMHDKEAVKNTTYYVPWIIRRVRLMLQIGLTFELELDFERAQAQYHAAHWLIRALTQAAFEPWSENNKKNHDGDKDYMFNRDEKRWVNNFLKHVGNLLIQPILSEAWIAEKTEAAIDTSSSMVESYLIDVRRTYPFLKQVDATRNRTLHNYTSQDSNSPQRHAAVGDSNFALIGADLHDKAGDLYFFKGRGAGYNRLKFRKTLNSKANTYIDMNSTSGYLSRSKYHYAISLHEIRRFKFYRLNSSRFKFNILKTNDKKSTGINTFSEFELPSHEIQSIANYTLDLSEALLGGLSFLFITSEEYQKKIINNYSPKLNITATCKETVSNFNKKFIKWFFLSDHEIDKIYEKSITRNSLISIMTKHMGHWFIREGKELKSKDIRIVGFEKFDNSDTDFYVSILFSICSAQILRDGGFYTGSRNELYAVLSTLNRYLKWLRIYCEPFDKRNDLYLPFAKNLVELTAYALNLLDDWENKDDEDFVVLGVTRYAPKFLAFSANAYLSIASLAYLDTEDNKYFSDSAKKIKKEHLDCFESELKSKKKLQKPGRSTLGYLITRHKYPALLNMEMLKNLLDDTLLTALVENQPEKKAEEINHYFEEVCDIERRFDSPMLFTPSMLAETAYLTWKYRSKLAEGTEMKSTEYYRHFAYTQVLRAEQMFTQGNEYYKNISQMYYLFDDFNDRTLHTNHAQQMAGADLLAVFKEELKKG